MTQSQIYILIGSEWNFTIQIFRIYTLIHDDCKVTRLHIANPYQLRFGVCGRAKVYRKFGKLNCCAKIRHYLGEI